MESKENSKNNHKLLMVITKGNFGGAQRYVYDLATHLVEKDFDIVVACGHGNILKNKLEEKGIKVVELKSSQRDVNLSKDIKTYLELRKILLNEKPDILHLNSSKIGGIGALLGRICGVKRIIFTAHGWASNENRSFLSKILITLLQWTTVFLSHKTIAVSRKAKNDVSWLPFIKNKIEVVYNGIDIFETLDTETARNILSKETNTEKKIIFSLSELHKNKGIDIALKGIAKLPTKIKENILYVVAGDGEEKEKLINMTKDLCIENNVNFLGYFEDGKKLITGADIFLLPSRTEAFPYAILEAGILGKPIIASSVGGIPEVIDNMENGILVHPKNPKEISEGITYLLEHKDLEKRFGEKIVNKINSNFNLEKMVSETIELYLKY